MDDIVRSYGLVRLEEGVHVGHEGETWVISEIVNLSRVTIRRLKMGREEVKTVDIRDLENEDKDLTEESSSVRHTIYENVSVHQWSEAEKKHSAVEMLLQRRKLKKSVAEIAKEFDCSIASLYNWKAQWLKSERVADFIGSQKFGGRGKGRLSPQMEALIESVISTKLENGKPVSVSQAHKSLEAKCHSLGLKIPTIKTLRLRLSWLNQREHLAKRLGKKNAASRFDPVRRNSIRAEFPLAMVQIDHCIVDVIIVHDETREPLCRMWVTLAIDVSTRVVTGVYFSLNYPSATSVGACIAHSILPKEKYLEQCGVEMEWPVWGVMRTLHSDNGRDFHCERLEKPSLEYAIESQFRPVATPNFGGHIERLIGTFNQQMKMLPGWTNNKLQKNKEYDAEKTSAMQESEFIKWFLYEINAYHHTPHSGIGNETPMERYKKAYLNPGDGIPRSLPTRRLDTERVHIDFLPELTRTVKRDGIEYGCRHYWAPVLQEFVGYRLPGESRNYKFRCKVDDRDVSFIFFYNEVNKRWYKVPVASLAAVPTTRSNFASEKKRLEKKLERKVAMEEVYRSISAGEKIVDEAIAKTIDARINKRKKSKGASKSDQTRDQKRREQDDRSKKSSSNDHASGSQGDESGSDAGRLIIPSFDSVIDIESNF